MKLDIGCGPNKREGFYGVDQHAYPGVDKVVDLTGRWPFDDDSVDELHCSHVLEHFGSKQRCWLMNEMYRVMKKDAKALIIVPHWSSERAYGDPTHVMPPVVGWFFYYCSKEWREKNAPHTMPLLDCDFHAVWGASVHPDLMARNDEFKLFAMQWYKEASQDLHVTLTKR
jgi:hypothetical protein